jgi:hypothetical protein
LETESLPPILICGQKVIDTGSSITVPVGVAALGRIMNVISEPIDECGPIRGVKLSPFHADPCPPLALQDLQPHLAEPPPQRVPGLARQGRGQPRVPSVCLPAPPHKGCTSAPEKRHVKERSAPRSWSSLSRGRRAQDSRKPSCTPRHHSLHTSTVGRPPSLSRTLGSASLSSARLPLLHAQAVQLPALLKTFESPSVPARVSSSVGRSWTMPSSHCRIIDIL